MTSTEYSTQTQQKHSPQVHRTFSRRDHTLGNKTNINKFKRIENLKSIFSIHTMALNQKSIKGRNLGNSKCEKTKTHAPKLPMIEREDYKGNQTVVSDKLNEETTNKN